MVELRCTHRLKIMNAIYHYVQSPNSWRDQIQGTKWLRIGADVLDVIGDYNLRQYWLSHHKEKDGNDS